VPSGITELNSAAKELYDGLLDTPALRDAFSSTAAISTEPLRNTYAKFFKTAAAINETTESVNAARAALGRFKAAATKLGSKVGVGVDTAALDEAAASLGKFTTAPLAPELEKVAQDFEKAATNYRAVGGLTPAALEGYVKVGGDKAVRIEQAAAGYARKAQELAGALGVEVPPDLAEFAGNAENVLQGLRGRSVEVPGSMVADLRSSQNALKEAIGVKAGGSITGGDITRIVTTADKAELVSRVQKLDDYFSAARRFADSSNNPAMSMQIDRVEQRISDSVEEALHGAGLERLDKSMLALALGAEIIDHTEFHSGVADKVLTLAALHKLLRSGKGGGRSASLLKRMFGRAAGSAASQAAYSAVPGGSLVRAGAAGAMRTLAYNAANSFHDATVSAGTLEGMTNHTRGRMASALGIAGKGATVAAERGQLGITWLQRSRFSFFEGEQPPIHAAEHSDMRATYEARANELARFAAAPTAAQARIHEQVRPLRMVNEQLADQVEMQAIAIPAYLQEKAPKDPGTIQTLGRSHWHASDEQIMEFSEHVRGALSPMSVLEGALEGDISPEAAEAVRTLWPNHMRNFQELVLTHAAELESKLTYPQLVRLSILLDAPVDSTMDDDFRAFMITQHASRAQAAEEQSTRRSSAGTNKQAEDEFSPAQKLGK
jgi:hypothetical protein